MNKSGRMYEVEYLMEKPPVGNAPSRLAIMGRYILTPEIFTYLEHQEEGAGGEIQLTDAIQKLNENHGVYAYEFEGIRYDVGEKLGFIMTTLDFALQNKELRMPLLQGLETILEREHLGKINS